MDVTVKINVRTRFPVLNGHGYIVRLEFPLKVYEL